MIGIVKKEAPKGPFLCLKMRAKCLLCRRCPGANKFPGAKLSIHTRGNAAFSSIRYASVPRFDSHAYTVCVTSINGAGMNVSLKLLTLSTQPIPLRLYTEVACGWPSPAADYEESPLSLDELVDVTASCTFLMPATDNSMHPLISAEDVLIVRRGRDAFAGDVVVASVNDEFLIRRLGRVGAQAGLIADNCSTSPTLLGDGEAIEVFGVVAWNFRQLYRPRRHTEGAYQSLDELARVSAYSTFLVRARGASMAPLILDGDVLVVDRSIEAEQGDIVLAVRQGDFTVKRLGTVMDRPALIPENRAMPPIFIGKDDQVDIWGVAVWNLHQLHRSHGK